MMMTRTRQRERALFPTLRALEYWRQVPYLNTMPMTIEQLEQEALALPSEARALLADRLVESLDAAAANRIDKLWATGAKRRRDEVRQGRVRTIPGKQALARVRRSVG